MDLVALRTLAAIAQAGGVTPAARRLNCVPSAVTARLRALETEVGQPLFVRRPRGMTPTAAGEILLGYADRAIRLVDDAARAVAPGAAPQGRLRIGATDTAATVHLPPVFARYHEAHPAVALSIASDVTRDLLAGVRGHHLDAAVVNTMSSDPALLCERIRVERLVLASARSVADPFSGLDVTFLAARAGGAQRARIEEWWQASGGPPMRVIELASIGLRLSFAAAGIGVTAVPRSALDVLGVGGSLRLHPIAAPWRDQDMALVTRAGAPPFPALAAFRAMLLGGTGGVTAAAGRGDA